MKALPIESEMMELDYFLSQPENGNAEMKTLDFDKSPTVLLVFAANRYTRTSAKFYQKQFGIGAMDWRMLVMLTREPEIPVARISKVVGIDKAAVSRSLSKLQEKNLARPTIPKGDIRRKTWCLTTKGILLHNEVLQVALERQNQLLQGFSKQEVLQLNGFLKRLLSNISTLR